MKRVLAALILSLSFFSSVSAETNMYDRVCKRISERFGSDQVALERVNKRVEKRFGFICANNPVSDSKSPTILSRDPEAEILWKTDKALQEYWDYISSVIPSLPTDISAKVLEKIEVYSQYQKNIHLLANNANVRMLSNVEKQKVKRETDLAFRTQNQITILLLSSEDLSYVPKMPPYTPFPSSDIK